MCTVVVLYRPDVPWPVLLAANRDEMANRPWQPPGRHWPRNAGIVAGRDELAHGTWLGLNDDGVVAAVLNRINTLGPAPGFRSRGELPLMALAHADASGAVAAISGLRALDYRPFNMVVADRREGYWLHSDHDGRGDGDTGTIAIERLPEGLSMVTAYNRNDVKSPRMRRYLPQFEGAAIPDPDAGDWSAWTRLLGDRRSDSGGSPGGAMTVATDTGFGTVSSTLIALPGEGAVSPSPIWLFASGPPDRTPFHPVDLRISP
ncbi:MAG: NRDE family protein [Rhodospirillales bacterium]|nr:NRDE family protein [Rhodospirillales bacterium]